MQPDLIHHEEVASCPIFFSAGFTKRDSVSKKYTTPMMIKQASMSR